MVTGDNQVGSGTVTSVVGPNRTETTNNG